MNDDAREAVLRRRLGELAGLARTTPRTLLAAAELRPGKAPRDRRRMVVVGTAASLALVGGVATVWAVRSPKAPADISSITDPDTDTDTVPQPTTTETVVTTNPLPVAPPALQTIPDSPLEERTAAAVASIDDQLFVWGGAVPNHLDGSEPPYADGAIFDRSAGTWRIVATSPLPGGTASAISLGDTMVVLSANRVAQYHPADDTWTEVAPPVSVGLDQLVRLGDEIVALPAAVAWNGTAWRQLAVMPAFEPTTRAMTGANSIITWGPTAGSQTGDAWRYDATADQWSQLPTGPLTQVYEGTGAVVSADELIVVSWADMSAATLNLDTLTWRSLPNLPFLSVKCWVDAAVIDGNPVVSMCGNYAVLDTATSSWTTLRSPAAALNWSHTDLVPLGEDRVLSERVIVPAAFWTDDSAIGPVPVGSAAVDRAQVAGVDTTGDTLFEVLAELESGCTLTTVSSSRTGHLTLADAIEAEPTAALVEFWHELYGGFRLTCSDASLVADAARSITTPFD